MIKTFLGGSNLYIFSKITAFLVVSFFVFAGVISAQETSTSTVNESEQSSTTPVLSSFTTKGKEGHKFIDGNKDFKLELVSEKSDFAATDNLEFEFKFRERDNFVVAFAKFVRRIFSDEFGNLSVESQITSTKSQMGDNIVEVEYVGGGRFKVGLREVPRSLGIGKHSVEVFVSDPEITGGETLYFVQDFTWGVLAYNSNKSFYNLGEEAYLQMAVLDDNGDTLCDARVELEITDPEGDTITMKTEDLSIAKNPECDGNNVIQKPDYYSYFSPEKTGRYQVKMIAFTENGEREISDSFEVSDSGKALEIERVAPTRIYPYADYAVRLRIKANEDYEGEFVDKVPGDFAIKNEELKIKNNNKYNVIASESQQLLLSSATSTKEIKWDVSFRAGEEYELSYTIDFPNISPEFYLLGPLSYENDETMPHQQTGRHWQVASDAVGAGVAWVTATGTTAGTDLNQTSGYPLVWNSTDLDHTKYSYSASSPTRLTVSEDGDYLVSLTIPMYRVDSSNYRTRIEAEVRVNGTKRDVGVGRSSYIRNTGNQTESSDHLNVLLEDLTAGQFIEIYVKGITTYRANMEVYISDHAALLLQKIDDSEVVFAGTATQTTNSTDLSNTTPYELEWSESRKDTGYTHLNGTNPENITLDEAGDYLVMVNVPTYSATTRANLTGQIWLDGSKVSGGTFQQAYMRNADADNYASLHWAGVVQSTTTNQVLSVATIEDSAAATVTVGSDKATIFVQKLPSSDIYYGRGTELDVGTNWNDTTARNILWETDGIIDFSAYTHSTTSNAHRITVDKTGDYIVAYNDALDANAGRPNPLIEIRVNDNPIVGAQTKSHYIRQSSQESSASLVYYLDDVSATDYITVTTIREGDSDTTNDMDDATFFIKYIDDEIPPIGSFNSLAQKTDGSGTVDVSIEAHDGNQDSLRAKLEYEAGSTCAFTGSTALTIDATDINVSADYGDPDVDSNHEYQVGTSSAMIITTSGSNTVNFDWSSATDLPGVDGVYCVRLTLNDGVKDQATPATSTITIDNEAPSITNIQIPDLSYKVGDMLTATVTVASDIDVYTLDSSATINNATTTNLQKISDTTYTVDYVISEGDTDRTSGTIPVSIILSDLYGNSNVAYTSVQANTATIDANSPNITSIAIADNMFGIGDTMTATITVSADPELFTLDGSSTVNGKTPSNFQKINNSTYTFDYLVVEGDTDRSAGTIPVSIILSDVIGNSNVAYTSFDANTASVDATRPIIQAVYITNGDYGIGEAVPLVVDADESGYVLGGSTTVNGHGVGGFVDNTDTTYNISYTVSEGDIDRAAGTIPVNIIMVDDHGNENSPAFTTPSGNTAEVDANKPEILTISLPNNVYKIGDTVRATTTVLGDPDTYTLGTTTINGVDATNLQRISSTTYTFDITVGEGDTDRVAGTIPVSLMLVDGHGQYNDPASTTVETNAASIDANKPSISSVSFVPNSGVLRVGEVATATISMNGAETGLSAGSTLTINGVDVSSTFSEIGGGDYRLVYTISEGDDDHPDNDDLSVNLRFVDPAGNESDVYIQTDPNNRPGVDANSPVVSNVTFAPSSGLLKIGDIATATITADDTGYTAGTIDINGIDVSGSLVDNTDNTYTVTYTVIEGHTDIADAADLPINVSLLDTVGNESTNYNTADSGARPGVDANRPVISNVTFLPNSGVLKVGDIATATISSDGLSYTAGAIDINGVDVSGTLTDNADNTYSVTYTVAEGHADISDTADLPINVSLIDPAGNGSTNYNTSDSGGRPGVDGNSPTISNVTFLPTSGILSIGDTATATIVSDGVSYTAGTININGIDVSSTLIDNTDNTYTISYTVAEGHDDISDSSDLPINVSLIDPAGNESSNYNTADLANRPGVDGHAPVISNLTFAPSSGVLKIGDTATATITSDASGYTAGTLTINGVDVASTLTDNADNTYTISYTVSESDTDVLDSADLPVSISLVDPNSNENLAYTVSDSGGRPGVDANRPNISSVTFVPSSGLLKIGDIATATIQTIETGASIDSATINGVDVSASFFDNTDNTYTVSYQVTSGDTDIADSANLPVSFQMTDAAGNQGTLYNSADIGGRPGVDANLPTAPGNLSFASKTNSSITLLFGATSTESNFDEYRIYYKEGISGVGTGDSSWTSSDDSNLGDIEFNSATSTIITGLSTSTDYVFNIYAYDTSGNYSLASEVTVKTNSYPTTPGALTQYKNDGSTVIGNGAWVDEVNLKFKATTTDIDASEDLSMYFEMIPIASSSASGNAEPASSCANGTAYASCSGNIWKISTTTPAWYNPAWSYRKKITINASQVVATETDFVAFASTTDASLANNAREDAYDILFTSSDGSTKLDYEREYWASSTGELQVWIKTDVSSTSDTVVYMYYGNSSATVDNANPSGVWDSNYKGVWHLNTDPSTGTVYDSTSNNNDLTMSGSMTTSDLVSGGVGRALNFDGSDDYLQSTSPNNYGTATNYTTTAWFMNSTQSGYSNFYSHTTSGGDYDPQWTMNNTTITVYDGTGITFGTLTADDAWHRLDFVRTGTSLVTYLDGVSQGTQTHSGTLLSPTEIFIAESGDPNNENWAGELDEIRYSETSRSINSIRTEINNQKSVGSFMSFGEEEGHDTSFEDVLSIDSIPESASGYKWQVIACDDEGACSSWQTYNASTPNFKIDLANPTNPGALSVSTTTRTSVELNFGSATVESNFREYVIYYKIGTDAPTESDLAWATTSDSNLGLINFNGAATTTITNLTASTTYTFAIWAYDEAGNTGNSSFTTVTTGEGDHPPVAVFNSAAQKTDASGVVDISIEVDDPDNNDELRARIDYVAGASCDFSTPLDPTLDENTSNINSDYGMPTITNANTYQIGTSSGWILTSPGSNTVNFDWDTQTDIPAANGVYCLRLTVNDGSADQNNPATTTLTIDNIDPTSLGDLTVADQGTDNVTLNFGAQASDSNFSHYKIFYKFGDSGVTEMDSEHVDSDLNSQNYGGTTNTIVSSLASGVTYTFNIWAYDVYGNKMSATEVSATTNYTPDVSTNLKQLENDNTPINNSSLIQTNTVKLSASSTDLNSGETMTFYFETIASSSSFTTSTSEPASSCVSGTAYSSCSSNTWRVSDASGTGPANWYNSSWKYRKSVTIKASEVVANETDFPVLVSISDSDLAGKVRSDGFDVVFTDNLGTKLDYEREYINGPAGELVAWVKTDISSTTDTTIYLYYGNGSATVDNATTTAVWDSNYLGVWHLQDDPSGTVYDSTSNNNDMTSAGSMNDEDIVDGHFGRATDFDGSGDYLSTLSPNNYGTAGNYTVSVWFYNSAQSGYSNFYSHTTSGGDYDPQWTMNNTTITVYDGTGLTFGTLSADNEWHRMDFVRTGTSLETYLDGVSQGTQTHSGNLLTPTEVYISNSGSGNTEYWNGQLEEIRYSEVARNINTIRTEFNNQDDPSNFMNFGSEEVYTYVYDGQISIPSIPDSNAGYKWQVIACDSDNACSPWQGFNASAPNFSVDATAPTAPGALTALSQTANSITVNLGATTTDDNFTEYKVFYKAGSSGVTESDSEHASSTDASLGYIDYNGAATTTIGGLLAGTEYVFNIWAYDVFGRKASSSVELVTSTNFEPTSSVVSAVSRLDGTGVVDISIQADDGNDDDLRLRVDYEAGTTCSFGSPLDPSIDENDNTATSTYGDAKVENDNTYQVGNSSGWIETSSGANTVNFDWLSATDLASANGDYCLRFTANDQVNDQVIPATTTVTLDNLEPTAPGDLTLHSRTGTELVLSFGAQSVETNFVEYKIFYKEGAATVLETDTELVDADLAFINYNGTATTSLSGLNPNTQYSFKVFVYDSFGNKSNSGQVTFTTKAAPIGSFNSAAQKTDGSGVVDVSIEVYDVNLDDVSAKIEYVSGVACDFSSPLDPTLDESAINITADYGSPTITNSSEFQVGTSSRIITSSGSNTVNFDWDTATDLPAGDDTYCLRLTVKDDTDTGLVATTTLVVDNVAPTVPGDLVDDAVTGLSATIGFGSDSTDSNFAEYKIFYKSGSAGVTEGDNEYNMYNDANLAESDFNGATQTVIGSLIQNTTYYFNIWAYDLYGNKSNAVTEVSTTTISIPTATWRELEDTTDPTSGIHLSRGSHVRLRVSVSNTGDWDASNYEYSLQYGEMSSNCSAITEWKDVLPSATSSHWEMVTSDYYLNNSLTSQKLSNVEAYSFVPGKMVESPSATSSAITLSTDEVTEIEYNVQATASSTSGSTYCFRLMANETVLDNYNSYPEITLAPPPSSIFNNAAQRTDGSFITDVSLEVDDVNGDECRVKLEYELGTSCSFSSSNDPSIDTNDINTTADYGDPDIDNDHEYQIGTSSGMIVTSFGPNTLNFDWNSDLDLPGANATYCLRATVNDNYDDQTTPATTTVVIDQVNPTIPGDLVMVDLGSNSATLGLGTTTVDTNFSEYRIYYKEGIPGVTESDNMHASSSDPNLTHISYNGATTTTITGLDTNKLYYFKIFAYDSLGNKSSSAGELEITIRYRAKTENWRWYYDQHNETPVVPMAEEEVSPNDIVSGATTKLRLAMRELEGITGEDVKMRLQYSTYSNFSADVHYVGESGSSTALWVYSDGVDNDDEVISSTTLAGVSIGAVHNESGVSTSTFDHVGGELAEWEFTIMNNDSPVATTYYFRPVDDLNGLPIEVNSGFIYPNIITSAGALSFSNSGYGVGSSTEGVVINTASTENAIDFGNLTLVNEKIAAQRFVIDTNAGNGYQLFVYQRQNLISNSGADIDPVPHTNETPAAWPLSPDPSAFGYHSGDETLSGIAPSRFLADNTYAQFEGTMKEVSYSQIPVQNEIIDIVYRVEVGSMQEAGDYETEIVYILVPTF